MKRAAVILGLGVSLVAPSAFAQNAEGATTTEADRAPDQPPAQPATVKSSIALDDSGRNVGVAKKQQTSAPKRWSAGGVFETHRMVRQDDLQGTGRQKALNYLYLFAGYGITDYDRVQLRGGIYQRFLADEGESGVRADDIEPMYTRIIPLPWSITARASGSVILPTSYESQRADLYAAPRLLGQLDRQFGTFNLTFKSSNSYWAYKYKAGPGGDALPYASFNWLLNGEYAMPFHQSLSVGASAFTGIVLNHDPENANDPNVQRVGGATTDPNFGNRQPVQNTYGGELYVRYILPEVIGVKSDFTVGYSNGDFTLGSSRMNHDGVNRVYGFWRTNAELYAELGIRY